MLDSNGDYSFGKGQQNITYGVYAVAQAIETRLKLLKNEWWENTEEGLPLFQAIIGSGIQDKDIIDNIIKERIINTQDVISIEEFESTIENRLYTVSCKILTKYGYAYVNKTL